MLRLVCVQRSDMCIGSGIDCSLDLLSTGSELQGNFYLLKYQQ